MSSGALLSFCMAKIFTFKNKRHVPRWLAAIIAGLMRLYAWTIRCKINDPQGILAQAAAGNPVVLTLWHNRIIFAAPLIPLSTRRKGTVLVSASRDGEYISTIIRFFGIQAVRGSSSRGGAQALVELRKKIREGISPVLTVDGPRGPKYTVHAGAAVLGMRCQVPVVPICLNYRLFWQLRSWDKMQIPWPFTSAELTIGEPINLPPEADVPAALEDIRVKMLAITRDREEPPCQP